MRRARYLRKRHAGVPSPTALETPERKAEDEYETPQGRTFSHLRSSRLTGTSPNRAVSSGLALFGHNVSDQTGGLSLLPLLFLEVLLDLLLLDLSADASAFGLFGSAN